MVGPLQVAGAAVSNTSTAAGVSIKIVILFTHRNILVHIYKKVFKYHFMQCIIREALGILLVLGERYNFSCKPN